MKIDQLIKLRERLNEQILEEISELENYGENCGCLYEQEKCIWINEREFCIICGGDV